MVADNGLKVDLFVILKIFFAFEIFFTLVTTTPALVLNLKPQIKVFVHKYNTIRKIWKDLTMFQ